MACRHGYPASFLERQKALEIFYDHLGEGKKSVLTIKKVTHISHFDNRVVVRCADGTAFEGDIVIGADGVRSEVREQMWHYMDAHGLQKEAEKEHERTYSSPCNFSAMSFQLMIL